MSIRISSPELLIASSCALLIVGHQVAGWVFAALGVLGAVLRVVIENSIRLEKNKHEQEVYRSISGIGETILHAIGSMAASHRDDSDYN